MGSCARRVGGTRMNWPNRILFVINIVLAGLAAWAIAQYGLGPAPEGWRWGDLVIILLVAISVVLAALTIFLGVLAVWGYTQIRGDARRQAATTAREEVPAIARAEARRQAQAWLAEYGEQRTTDLARALSGRDDDGAPGEES